MVLICWSSVFLQINVVFAWFNFRMASVQKEEDDCCFNMSDSDVTSQQNFPSKERVKSNKKPQKSKV